MGVEAGVDFFNMGDPPEVREMRGEDLYQAFNFTGLVEEHYPKFKVSIM